MLNTIPKAIVYHQVKMAEEFLLKPFEAQVAGMEEEALGNLLGEDPQAAVQRRALKDRVTMLRKAYAEITNFQG